MSLLSRVFAPAATGDLADLVAKLLAASEGTAPRSLGRPSADVERVAVQPPPPSAIRQFASGLGTAAVRTFQPFVPDLPAEPLVEAPAGGRGAPVGPTGLGSSSARAKSADEGGRSVPELYCPPAVRDDPALGEVVNERLVEWAEEIGIYPGQLDRVRAADFGRLIMLAHPESDDPDRLLAAAKCALSEWAVDDHYVDGEAETAHPELLGQRLAIAHSVIDQAHLPLRYAPELEQIVQYDPVMMALRSGLDNLAEYATWTQVRRLRHELGIMFVAYNQEAVWHTAEQTPPVWEFLMHRHENSFVPCMVLIDTIAGYELPYEEFADPRVRRAFTMAGSASVIVNDLYSMGKEDPTDFSLPRIIAAEEHCSLEEAVQRTVDIHDELMHTYETEAAALLLTGSPALQRFLAGVWAWLGGSREWHAGSARYATASR